jgi:hypothetical protein
VRCGPSRREGGAEGAADASCSDYLELTVAIRKRMAARPNTMTPPARAPSKKGPRWKYLPMIPTMPSSRNSSKHPQDRNTLQCRSECKCSSLAFLSRSKRPTCWQAKIGAVVPERSRNRAPALALGAGRQCAEHQHGHKQQPSGFHFFKSSASRARDWHCPPLPAPARQDWPAGANAGLPAPNCVQ